MKRRSKAIAVFAVLGMLVGATPGQVYACDKTENCYSEETVTYCIDKEIHAYTYYHQATDPNGYTSVCTITTLEGTHEICCTSCGVVLSSVQKRCMEEHSRQYCYDRYGICGGI